MFFDSLADVGNDIFGPLGAEALAHVEICLPHGARHADLDGWSVVCHERRCPFPYGYEIVRHEALVCVHGSDVLCVDKVYLIVASFPFLSPGQAKRSEKNLGERHD